MESSDFGFTTKIFLVGYCHIYHRYNQRVDYLSKMGTGLQEGLLHYKEFLNDQLVEEGLQRVPQ